MSPRGYITLGGTDFSLCSCGRSRPQRPQAEACATTLSGWGLAGLDAKAQGAIASSGAAGRITQSGGGAIYVPGTPDCAASGISGAGQDLQLAGKAGGLALTGAQVAGVVSAPFTFGLSIAISGIVGIFSTIFNHHAQAVAKEQNVLCTAVPAANNYLNVIDQAVASGAATAQQALQALDSLASDFQSTVSGIYKSCNAACVMQMCLAAAIATQKAKYTALAQQQASAAAAAAAAPRPVVSTVTPSVAPGAAQSSGPSAAPPVASGSTLVLPPAAAGSTSSLPSWWPLAALALLGFAIGEFA